MRNETLVECLNWDYVQKDSETFLRKLRLIWFLDQLRPQLLSPFNKGEQATTDLIVESVAIIKHLSTWSYEQRGFRHQNSDGESYQYILSLQRVHAHCTVHELFYLYWRQIRNWVTTIIVRCTCQSINHESRLHLLETHVLTSYCLGLKFSE